ncbi:winged helix-turn-helix domain-containing protein [Chloroflexota bacterium]
MHKAKYRTKIPRFRPKKAPHFSHHPEANYSIRGRIWLEKYGELYIGWGRVLLLENIDRLGSIAAAARTMKLGYRNAWLWVESANRLAPAPLVEKTSGGVGGGRTRLTKEGRETVNDYKELFAKFQDFLNQVK